MDDETLISLLCGQHLSMPDRLARGVWPHPPLQYSDLVHHLAELLRREVSFPRPWRSHEPGRVVHDGGVIERCGDKFLYRWQRANPVNPLVLAEHSERTFESAEEAASHYLTSDLHLPGDLDGWKVIR